MGLWWGWLFQGMLNPSSPLILKGPGTPYTVLFPPVLKQKLPDLSPPREIKRLCEIQGSASHSLHTAPILSPSVLWGQEALLLGPDTTQVFSWSCGSSSQLEYGRVLADLDEGITCDVQWAGPANDV